MTQQARWYALTPRAGKHNHVVLVPPGCTVPADLDRCFAQVREGKEGPDFVGAKRTVKQAGGREAFEIVVLHGRGRKQVADIDALLEQKLDEVAKAVEGTDWEKYGPDPVETKELAGGLPRRKGWPPVRSTALLVVLVVLLVAGGVYLAMPLLGAKPPPPVKDKKEGKPKTPVYPRILGKGKDEVSVPDKETEEEFNKYVKKVGATNHKAIERWNELREVLKDIQGADGWKFGKPAEPDESAHNTIRERVKKLATVKLGPRVEPAKKGKPQSIKRGDFAGSFEAEEELEKLYPKAKAEDIQRWIKAVELDTIERRKLETFGQVLNAFRKKWKSP
ncbi:MAG: hypothetical protein K2W96_01230 [Gemmataceae bacterium]|nr:hypothetical protein [Gemmataceae bacterium]